MASVISYDVFGPAHIHRDKQSKKAFLTVRRQGEWRLYAGGNMEGIDFSLPALQGQGAGTFAVPAVGSAYSVFALAFTDTTMILAERRLPMAGGFNFRDLGGLPAGKEHCLAWGMFFRADDMSSLTPEDLAYLSSIPLRTVVDFRAPDEVTRAPDKIPASVTRVLDYAIIPARIDPTTIKQQLQGKSPVDFMHNVYRQLTLDTNVQAIYRNFFSLTQNKENLPLLFHCSAGKDRTGLASALILLALGVDRETVMRDYLASVEYLENKYADLRKKLPHFTPFLTVQPEYLETALSAMEEAYGSVERYLTQALSVDLKRMRQNCLHACSTFY